AGAAGAPAPAPGTTSATPGAVPAAAAAVAAAAVAGTGATTTASVAGVPAGPTAAPGAPAAPGRALTRLITAYGLFGFGYVVTATFLGGMARGLPDARIAEPIAWLAVGLFAIPSTAFWQWVAARTGIWRALRIAFAAEAVGVVLAGYGTGTL